MSDLVSLNQREIARSPWRPVTLEQIAEAIFDGPFGSNLKSDDYVAKGVRVVRLENIGHLRFNSEKQTYITEQKYEQLRKHLLRAEDVLFSSFVDEEVRVCLFPDKQELAINKADCFCIRVDRSFCDPRWLTYRLADKSTYEVLKEKVHGATRPRVNLAVLKSFGLDLPPPAEQRRIVAKIDSLSSKSKRARERLDHVPRLVEKHKQAVLAAAFRGDLTKEWRKGKALAASSGEIEAIRQTAWQGVRSSGQLNGSYKPGLAATWYPKIDLPIGWTWASVDQLAFLVQYGTSAKTNDNSDGVAVLRMGNIREGSLEFSSLKFLPAEHGEFPDLLLRKGDVVFNRTNSAELVGKSAVYRGIPDRASFASYLIRVRCSGLLPELLSNYINSSIGREWVASVVNQQVGQANVNGTKLRELGVPVMPKKEQREIARRIEYAFTWIDHLAAEASTAHELVDRLDEAILAKAFRGELVPQDPTDEPASVLLDRIRAQQGPTQSKTKRR